MLDTDRTVVLTNKMESVTDRPDARWMQLGSVTRVRNGLRNIKHFTDHSQQAWKLQPTITDYANICPNSPKRHSYRAVGSSGTPASHI